MARKVFVFYYEWKSTEGNHAGMAYLARAIENAFPRQVVLLKEPAYQKGKDSTGRYWCKQCWLWFTIVRLSVVAKSTDDIFFTEYGGIGWQTKIARLMKFIRPVVRRVGLIHLPMQVLKNYYGSEQKLQNVLDRLNKILVFGSSLERQVNELLTGQRVTRTFHYVDDYYVNRQRRHLEQEGPLQVLFVGNLMRNYDLLRAVIEGADPRRIVFHICGGAYHLQEIFGRFSHVKLYSYLREDELLDLMKKAEVSLNIFDDTIGSNVITTSMACGLALVASDVGSIRDYAGDDCAILCKNKAVDIIQALHRLQQDRPLLKQKGEGAIKRSGDFRLNKSLVFFKEYFQLN